MTAATRLQETVVYPIMRKVIGSVHRLEDSLATRPDAVRPSPLSPRRFEIILAGLTLESGRPPLPGFPKSVRYLQSSVRNIRRSILSLKDNPSHPRTDLAQGLLPLLEDYARSQGVDEVGYAKLRPEWVFRDKAVMYDNAIVLVMEMDKRRMESAPSKDTAVMVHETYDRLGQASNRIAEFLRAKGCGAHAGHPLLGLALYPPLAQAAGLGWRGLSGLLVTPKFGPRVRLAAVFTSIEGLPYGVKNQHSWIAEYCDSCRVCVRDCPAGAIREEPIAHPNGLVTCVEDDACFPYFAQNHGCSVCIRVCPFNRTDYHRLRSHFQSEGKGPG